MDEYDQRYNHQDWQVSSEDQKNGLVIWQRTTEEGLKAVKCEGIVDQRPIDIFKVIGDDRYRRSYDSNYDGSSLLEKIADQTYICY